MDAVLTGADAREALGVYMGLGNAGARFNASTVDRLVRSSGGRRRITTALFTALRYTRPRIHPRRALRAALRLRRTRAAGASPGIPPRPAGLSAARRAR